MFIAYSNHSENRYTTLASTNSELNFQDEVNRDHLLGVAVLIGTAFFVFTLTVCCLYRLVRRRRWQKRQHFSRLVSDLNAQEKFAIAGQSDEESSD